MLFMRDSPFIVFAGYVDNDVCLPTDTRVLTHLHLQVQVSSWCKRASRQLAHSLGTRVRHREDR